MLKRLTVVAAFVIAIASCKKTEDRGTYVGNNIVLNTAQAVPAPATPSSATGSASASYDATTRTLSYTVNWSNTNDSVTAIRVHGPANPGFAGAVLQAFSNSVTAQTVPPRRKSGSYSGTLLVDNTVVKEDELLGGLYYIAIYTKTSGAAPELRSQLYFNKQ